MQKKSGLRMALASVGASGAVGAVSGVAGSGSQGAPAQMRSAQMLPNCSASFGVDGPANRPTIPGAVSHRITAASNCASCATRRRLSVPVRLCAGPVPSRGPARLLTTATRASPQRPESYAQNFGQAAMGRSWIGSPAAARSRRRCCLGAGRLQVAATISANRWESSWREGPTRTLAGEGNGRDVARDTADPRNQSRPGRPAVRHHLRGDHRAGAVAGSTAGAPLRRGRRTWRFRGGETVVRAASHQAGGTYLVV